MKASEFATDLRNQVIKLTLDNQLSVSTQTLTNYLDKRISELENAEKHHAQITTDLQVEHYKAKTVFSREMLVSVLDYGKHALNAGKADVTTSDYLTRNTLRSDVWQPLGIVR